jgi:hypothetical protein
VLTLPRLRLVEAAAQLARRTMREPALSPAACGVGAIVDTLCDNASR